MIRYIIFMILFSCIVANADMSVDIKDHGQGKAEIIITDMCDVPHSKIFTSKELEAGKALKWLQKLQSDKNFNSCIDSN